MSQPVPSQELAHSNNHGVPYSDAISTLVADGSEDVENLPGEERERSAGDLKSTENEEDWEDDDDMEEAEGTETIKKPKNFSDLPIELRLKIWNDTLPGLSLILDRASVAVLYDFDEQKVQRRDFNKWSIHPVALRVCRESRQEALRSYSVLHSKIDNSYTTSSIPSEVPSVLNHKGYGQQWINYKTDTLFLPHTRVCGFEPTRKADCEKVRSLMIAKDRLWSFNSTPVVMEDKMIHGSWRLDYKKIISNFPNLEELFVCTNWMENCDITQGQALPFTNDIPLKNLTSVCSDIGSLLPTTTEAEESELAKEAQELRSWILLAKDRFNKVKRKHPECKWEPKFVGGPLVLAFKKYDCGCCTQFDPLGMFKFVPDRPCVIARTMAAWHAMWDKA